MRYSRMLEESSFANKKADYFWLLLQSSIMLLVNTFFISLFLQSNFESNCFFFPTKILSPLFNLPFLSSSLAFVPIYLWSRRHPSTPISLFGLITITAPYLPVALVLFSWILSGTWKAATGDLVGCAVGHIGWFLRDVWTREMVGGTSVFSEAPVRLCVYSSFFPLSSQLLNSFNLQEKTVWRSVIWSFVFFSSVESLVKKIHLCSSHCYI